jgi:ribosome-binding ATPase YchF (GTP1/OBG family)
MIDIKDAFLIGSALGVGEEESVEDVQSLEDQDILDEVSKRLLTKKDIIIAYNTNPELFTHVLKTIQEQKEKAERDKTYKEILDEFKE